MRTVGFIGWRGMVGSVLMERLLQEGQFKTFIPTFYSTSQKGMPGPGFLPNVSVLQDAYDLDALMSQDILVSCQGGAYTEKIYPQLKAKGYKGYWLDAASTLRMQDDAIIVLDPVNQAVIDSALARGLKTFVGGNCTVSLALMALAGLFQADWIEWMISHTYQAASGAGAKHMQELLQQMQVLSTAVVEQISTPQGQILEIDRQVTSTLQAPHLPTQHFGAPLAGSVIPWIDTAMPNGQTREEWKGAQETNKILGLAPNTIPVDGLCVRVGAMRCHAQAITLKLKRNYPLAEIEQQIAQHNEWVKIVPNEKAATLKYLTPAVVSGSLQVPIGRIRKMSLGEQYLTAFTVGDQLLWGAAEPIRRMLALLT